jgi:hypothetical protein
MPPEEAVTPPAEPVVVVTPPADPPEESELDVLRRENAELRSRVAEQDAKADEVPVTPPPPKVEPDPEPLSAGDDDAPADDPPPADTTPDEKPYGAGWFFGHHKGKG